MHLTHWAHCSSWRSSLHAPGPLKQCMTSTISCPRQSMLLNTFSPLGDVPRVKSWPLKLWHHTTPVALLRCHMAVFQPGGEDIKAGLVARPDKWHRKTPHARVALSRRHMAVSQPGVQDIKAGLVARPENTRCSSSLAQMSLGSELIGHWPC